MYVGSTLIKNLLNDIYDEAKFPKYCYADLNLKAYQIDLISTAVLSPIHSPCLFVLAQSSFDTMHIGNWRICLHNCHLPATSASRKTEDLENNHVILQ